MKTGASVAGRQSEFFLLTLDSCGAPGGRHTFRRSRAHLLRRPHLHPANASFFVCVFQFRLLHSFPAFLAAASAWLAGGYLEFEVQVLPLDFWCSTLQREKILWLKHEPRNRSECKAPKHTSIKTSILTVELVC